MEGIFAALSMVVSFSLMNLFLKDLRNKGVKTFGVLAIFGFGVPFWIILGLFLTKDYGINLSKVYLIYVLIWVLGVAMINFLGAYLFRYAGLSELTAYGLTFSTVSAIVADSLLFDIIPTIVSLIAISCFFVGGFILTSNRNKLKQKIGTWKVLLIIMISSLLNVAIFSVYKLGLGMQTNILVHVSLSQSLLHGIYFIVGFNFLKKGMKKKIVTEKHILFIPLLLILGATSEAFALSKLPIVIIMLMGVLPLAIYSVFDIKKKEILLNVQSIFAVSLVFVGLIVLGVHP